MAADFDFLDRHDEAVAAEEQAVLEKAAARRERHAEQTRTSGSSKRTGTVRAARWQQASGTAELTHTQPSL
jgi:hypothetical protein